MDAQELRNLQEAYMEIVENQQLDEGKSRRKIAQMYGQSDMKMDYDERNLRNRGDLSKRDAGSIARSRLKGQLSAVGRLRGTSPHVDGRRVNNEEVDIYDIVLSHLLDEGYADTIESAEAIMVNMSEEWREDIIDEGLGKLAALGAAGLMMTQTGFKAPPGLLNKPLKEPQKTELVSKPKPTKSRDEKAERSQFDKRYNEYGGDAAARKRGLLPPK